MDIYIVFMGVNYYKQFDEFKRHYEFSGKKIKMDKFEASVMEFYGFSRKAAKRWMGSFEDVGYIKIDPDENGVWFVEVL